MQNIRKILTTGVFVFALATLVEPADSYASNNEKPMIKSTTTQKTSKCASCWNCFKSDVGAVVKYVGSDSFRNKLSEIGTVMNLLHTSNLLPSTVPMDKIQTVLNITSGVSQTLDEVNKEGTLADRLQTILKNAGKLTPALEEAFPKASETLNKIKFDDKTAGILEVISTLKKFDTKDTLTDWESIEKPLNQIVNTAKINVKNIKGSVKIDPKKLENNVVKVKKLLDPNDESVDFKIK